MEKQLTVFISGAGRGLGRHLAQSYHARGWRVYATSRRPSMQVFEGVDLSRLVTGPLDVTDYRSCENAIKDCVAKLGPIDILINNASGYSGKPIGEYGSEELELEVRTTFLGAVNLTNVFVSTHAEKPGKRHVVFIASTAGLGGEPGNGDCCVYAASKAAIIRFSECIGETLPAKNIVPHALVPTDIRTTRSETAVSYDDVLAAIDGMIESGDKERVLLAERSSQPKQK